MTIDSHLKENQKIPFKQDKVCYMFMFQVSTETKATTGVACIRLTNNKLELINSTKPSDFTQIIKGAPDEAAWSPLPSSLSHHNHGLRRMLADGPKEITAPRKVILAEAASKILSSARGFASTYMRHWNDGSHLALLQRYKELLREGYPLKLLHSCVKKFL